MKDDRKVLRFDCAWDSRDRLYGTISKYTLHYFLKDDTIEILEKHERNSGSDSWPRLLNRAVIHKDEGQSKEVYQWHDFYLGAEVKCYGRKLILLDCDNFTKEFYEAQGLDLGEAIEMNLPETPKPEYIPPPHTSGIGSEEDSLESCKRLQPKAPRRDIKKLLEMDRKILRFAAVFADPIVDDRMRKFLINYYLADDTISVSEPPIRNSGINGGKFLKRGKYFNDDGTFLSWKEFALGKEVLLLKHRFKLTDADEYTIKYLQNQHKILTPQVNISAIITKLTTKLKKEKFNLGKAFRIVDVNHSGFIALSELKTLINHYFPSDELSTKDLVIIMRFFDSSGEGLISINEFVEKLNNTNLTLTSHEIGGGLAKMEIPEVDEEYTQRCFSADVSDVDNHNTEKVLFAFANYLTNRGIGIQKVFNIFDKDGSGILEKAEFRNILAKSEIIPGSMSEKNIDIITDFFADGQHMLDLREFREKLLQVFKDFDTKEMDRKIHRNIKDTTF